MTYPAYPQHRDPTAVMGRRILAYIIDAVLSFAVVVVLFLALAESTEVPSFIDNACDIAELEAGVNNCFQVGDTVYTVEDGDVAVVWLSGLGVGFLNAVLLQGATGASVGKAATALRVVDVNGQVCGFGRALVRWLLLIVDAYFCFLIGLIVALVSKGHQRVGDMVAKTYVVGARDLGAAPVPVPAYTPQADYAQHGGWTPPTSAPPAGQGWSPPPPPGNWPPPQQ